MPKVGTQTFRFKEGDRRFDIYYSKTDGFTLKGFPPEFTSTVKAMDGHKGWFNTEAELVAYYKETISRYYEIVSTERHIILIRLSLSTELTMNHLPEQGHYSGYQPWFQPIRDKIIMAGHGNLKYGIGFEYQTGVVVSGKEDKFFKTTRNENGEVIHKAQYASSYREDGTNQIVMDYSLELDTFLKSVEENMRTLAQRLATFLADKERLLIAAEQKVNLLTDGKSE